VRSWPPVPGTTKARLLEGALTEFGMHGYEAVGVTELAGRAGVTIGSLYHHFGNKLGLYEAVRADVERRLLDRLEGAAALAPDDLPRVLLVGFDYAIGAGFARMLAEPHPERQIDPLEEFLTHHMGQDGPPIGRILAAAWRAALQLAQDDPRSARAALLAVLQGAGS
jgi:AcrR family transcriptional regulator